MRTLRKLRIHKQWLIRLAVAALLISFANGFLLMAAQHRSRSERMRYIVLSHEQHEDGWVVDHKWPLCAGGCDCAENMQWQPHELSLVKDRDERRLCEGYLTAEAYAARWHVQPMLAPCPCSSQ